MRSTPSRRFRDTSRRAQREREYQQWASEKRAESEERERQRLASEQLAEQRRRAEDAERRRHDQHNQSHADTSGRRLAALEHQWAAFRSNVQRAQLQAQQQQRYANARLILEDLERSVNPPPEPEPQVVYVPEEEWGSPRLGSSDFNPKLFSKPLRWW